MLVVVLAVVYINYFMDMLYIIYIWLRINKKNRMLNYCVECRLINYVEQCTRPW